MWFVSNYGYCKLFTDIIVATLTYSKFSCIGQHQNQGQSAVVQGSSLQGQTVLIQGGGPTGQGQTFMLQNTGQQGQVSIITTSLSQSATTQSIQIVQQQQQQQAKLTAGLQG